MDTKKCNHCGEVKPIEEFAWRWKSLGKRQKSCRQCMSKFSRRHYKKKTKAERERTRKNVTNRRKKARKYVWNYLKKHPCVSCGERDPRVLEFDHINSSNKTAPVSKLVSDGYGLDTIKAEIAKCQVLCANCHRKKSYKEGGWFSG